MAGDVYLFNPTGQVIIDKNPGVTCVVNKTNTIDSTYRNFQMEVLAGENNMVAKVRWRGNVQLANVANIFFYSSNNTA